VVSEVEGVCLRHGMRWIVKTGEQKRCIYSIDLLIRGSFTSQAADEGHVTRVMPVEWPCAGERGVSVLLFLLYCTEMPGQILEMEHGDTGTRK
jgi:hypothetical protein